MSERCALATVLLRPCQPDEALVVESPGPLAIEGESPFPLRLPDTLALPVGGDVLRQPGAEPLPERGLLGRVAQVHRHTGYRCERVGCGPVKASMLVKNDVRSLMASDAIDHWQRD